MSRIGVKNKTVNIRKSWNHSGNGSKCSVCGNPFKNSGFEKYCSRECYRAVFAKYRKGVPA